MKYRQSFALLFIWGLLISTSVLSAAGGGEPQTHREIIRKMPARPEIEIELISADCFIETGPSETIIIRIDSSYPVDRYPADIQEYGGILALRERILRRTASGSATWHITVPEKSELLSGIRV